MTRQLFRKYSQQIRSKLTMENFQKLSFEEYFQKKL